MGVFLTEGRRMQPQNARKQSARHPWKTGMSVSKSYTKPAHVGDNCDDSTMLTRPGMASGCYITARPNGHDD